VRPTGRAAFRGNNRSLISRNTRDYHQGWVIRGFRINAIDCDFSQHAKPSAHSTELAFLNRRFLGWLWKLESNWMRTPSRLRYLGQNLRSRHPAFGRNYRTDKPQPVPQRMPIVSLIKKISLAVISALVAGCRASAYCGIKPALHHPAGISCIHKSSLICGTC
jgi:hypothetical protein